MITSSLHNHCNLCDGKDSPEEMAAGIVLSMNDILRQVEYEAAAAQATTRDGTVCWIVVVIYYL